ncbi:hypothetical protein FRB95_000410 [Tulasnella sp. JGI-2019a]|nr:hypothetical protein FRB93_006276 [Tulasnella sp. JGI-2019a]KAG9033231.1 hypothetical protein FRB95_000410 [Tulasnella sp. JGI-2019a]
MDTRSPLVEKNVFPSSQSDDLIKPVKKQRTKKTKPAVENAVVLPPHLGHIMQMPVDIFAEIASNLTPFCLLTLSRSSKRLRDILISDSSKPIWRAARASIQDLPDCPQDLSEPQYARLMFEGECYVCHRPTKKVDLQIRIRCCHRCHLGYESFFQAKRFHNLFPDIPSTILQAVPSTGIYYYIPMVQQVAHKYKGLRGQSNVRVRWIQKRWELTQSIEKTIPALSLWLEKEVTEKRQKNHDTMLKRKAEIIANLQELGWQTADYPPDNVEFWSILDQPRELTPRIWSSVKPKLVQYLEDENTLRARLSRSARMSQAEALFVGDNISFSGINLNFHSVKHLPSITSIVDDDSLATLDAVEMKWETLKEKRQREVTEHVSRIRCDLARLFTDVSGIGQTTYRQIKDDIANRVLPLTTEEAYETNLLLSSCAVFTCTHPQCQGRRKLRYPYMLNHRHLQRTEWNLDLVRVEPAEVEFCNTLMRKLQLPVMDEERNGWMTCRSCIASYVKSATCLVCCRNGNGTFIMSWSRLLEHFLQGNTHGEDKDLEAEQRLRPILKELEVHPPAMIKLKTGEIRGMTIDEATCAKWKSDGGGMRDLLRRLFPRY